MGATKRKDWFYWEDETQEEYDIQVCNALGIDPKDKAKRRTFKTTINKYRRVLIAWTLTNNVSNTRSLTTQQLKKVLGIEE